MLTGVTGGLSESRGRERERETGASFHHPLTGGGEAARLIDYRLCLCIQGCCCCCGGGGLQHAALICWGTSSVSQPLSSVKCLPLASFLSLSFFHWPSPFPPFIPLITPSFCIPCSRSPTAISHISIFHSEGCEPTDGWWWMVRPTEFLFLSSVPHFPSVFGRLSFTWSRLCCLWTHLFWG